MLVQSPPGREARVRYLHGNFQLLSPGDYVRCAVTGAPIPLADLRYWDVERQEAYASAVAATQAYEGVRGTASTST